uniref:Uncharacterized protein n=1 Tax=Pseudomonas aeruginosa TaxID=287 RepID=A0A5E5R810_PSEAI|nr:hypothetical protein TUEID40_05274 [Pseudomonas aeruginosa]
MQQQQLVGQRQHRRLVGDQHQAAAVPAHRRDGLGQGSLTRLVEAGIGFVEHDQRRSPVQRAGQADALALAAGESGAAVAKARVVALRQAQHQVVHAGQARRRHHLLGIHLGEARDVLGDAAGEQLHVLGQVADVRPQCRRAPLPQVGAVQAHRAGQRLPGAHQQARQGRLAGTGRPDHAERFARFQGETEVLQQCLLASGAAAQNRSTRNAPRGAGSGMPRAAGGFSSSSRASRW